MVKEVLSANDLAVISESVKSSKEVFLKGLDKLEKNHSRLQWLMGAIIIVLFVGFITMVVMVGALIIDSFHINSAIYKEYSTKMNDQNTLISNNNFILEQIKDNQKSIQDLQNKIDILIKSKK